MTIARAAGVTDTGRRRRRNEDSFVCEPPIFGVADGMGGAQAGEIASQLAAAALREDAGEGASEERVAALIQEANRRVYDRASADANAKGMGTTMTVALVDGDHVTFGHVGDSRAYLVRDGRLEQVTNDHSLVAELVRSGKLSPEEAESHPQRSVITRALGTDPDVDVDTFTLEALPGDVFLLCSDGLTSMVDDELILQVLERTNHDLDAAAKELIGAANRGGGEDNITVVAFEIANARTGGEVEETRTMSAADQRRAVEDEQTLSEFDRVAAVDTMVVPPQEVDRIGHEHLREEQASPRWRRKTLLALVVLIVLAIAAFVAWRLLR